MGKLQNNQSGFGAIETILVIVIIAAIGFIGWYVHRALDNTNNAYNSATSTSNSASPKFGKVTKKTTTASSQSTQYLAITQLGFKIPLTSSTSDLSYLWQPSGGYSGYPVAVLVSKTLTQDNEQTDPTDCTAAKFSRTDSLYPIADIYSTEWSVGGTGGQTEVKSISVNGKNYYWYTLGSGSGCDFNPTATLSSDTQTYYNTVLASFSSSVAQ